MILDLTDLDMIYLCVVACGRSKIWYSFFEFFASFVSCRSSATLPSCSPFCTFFGGPHQSLQLDYFRFTLQETPKNFRSQLRIKVK
jgi:hypothetical protein